jgi:hypothetical protein
MVRRLKRYHYAFSACMRSSSRASPEPIYELKMAFSLHAHCCARHTAALRQRVGKCAKPLRLEAVPDPILEIFFDEILNAPTTGN